MFQLRQSKRFIWKIQFGLLLCLISFFVMAKPTQPVLDKMIDRAQFVKQQIELLSIRLDEANEELKVLKKQPEVKFSPPVFEKSGKALLDRASLDIIVAKSRVDSLTTEIIDAQQIINRLEKSVQEIQNQLNVLSIFGKSFAKYEFSNSNTAQLDLQYQKNLLVLEKKRFASLQQLKSVESNILNYHNEYFNRLKALLNSYKLLHVKQLQSKDELYYQVVQAKYLKQLAGLYQEIAKIDPINASKEYGNLERQIFYMNEQANYAYAQSLLARYRDHVDQIQLDAEQSQMAVGILSTVSEQTQLVNKQLIKLSDFVDKRKSILLKSIRFIKGQKEQDGFFANLDTLLSQYNVTNANIKDLIQSLTVFRSSIDGALKKELSLRQGFPVFNGRLLLDLGKELLLVPALTFKIIKNIYTHFINSLQTLPVSGWLFFIVIQGGLLFLYYRIMYWFSLHLVTLQSKFKLNFFMLRLIKRNLFDIVLFANFILVMNYFDIPFQSFNLVLYLWAIYLTIKVVIDFSRICLLETTHDNTGQDVKLYNQLKWVFVAGGIITALTVYLHQLPLIYELKSIADRLFLLLLMLSAILMIKFWHAVPDLVLSYSGNQHPYLEKSIRLLGFLIPALLFVNALIGLMGYMNLVKTVSRYEGIFLIVLIGYLVLRGILSDVMEQLSRLVIRYFSNGWLLTEAFLKPLDTILKLVLFLSAWAMLFLLFGWDKHSPMVSRLAGMLHYELINVLNTTITPLNILEVAALISIFYWTAKWTREFVYRFLFSRTQDMGIRNSLAIFSQYSVIIIGIFICLRVLDIDLRALAVVLGMLAFGVGLGLRDLVNNFASGFLILLERPLRVGDIVEVNGIEGEVVHIGSRAVTIRTWDHVDLLVPNAEIFNKTFKNLTAYDSVVRTLTQIKINRCDNPYEVSEIIKKVLLNHKDVLHDPVPDVILHHMNEVHMEFQLRFYVDMKQVKSRALVTSDILMKLWAEFIQHGVKPAYAQHELVMHESVPLPFKAKHMQV